MPVWAPVGLTTTQRFGRPSFVCGGVSSTNSNLSTSTKNRIAGWKFELRGEAFNLANRPIYRPAPVSITGVNFGRLSIEQQNFPLKF